MKANTISLNVLIDSSNFMWSEKTELAWSLNRLIEQYRNLDATVSLSVFTDTYQPIYTEQPIKDVEPFLIASEGNAPLIASSCQMIDEVGARLADKPEYERPEKVVFIVVTAGHDNIPIPQYTQEFLLARIREQANVYSWQFHFLGANPENFVIEENQSDNTNIAETSVVEYSDEIPVNRTTRLLCILSAQASPNVVSVQRYIPDRLVTIQTKEMENRGAVDDFLSALNVEGLDYAAKYEVVSIPEGHEFDFNELKIDYEELLNRYEDDNWIINLTGGTKPMSIAAFVVFSEAANKRFIYVDHTDGSIINLLTSEYEEEIIGLHMKGFL